MARNSFMTIWDSLKMEGTYNFRLLARKFTETVSSEALTVNFESILKLLANHLHRTAFPHRLSWKPASLSKGLLIGREAKDRMDAFSARRRSMENNLLYRMYETISFISLRISSGCILYQEEQEQSLSLSLYVVCSSVNPLPPSD